MRIWLELFSWKLLSVHVCRGCGEQEYSILILWEWVHIIGKHYSIVVYFKRHMLICTHQMPPAQLTTTPAALTAAVTTTMAEEEQQQPHDKKQGLAKKGKHNTGYR